eukprot:g12365.t1
MGLVAEVAFLVDNQVGTKEGKLRITSVFGFGEKQTQLQGTTTLNELRQHLLLFAMRHPCIRDLVVYEKTRVALGYGPGMDVEELILTELYLVVPGAAEEPMDFKMCGQTPLSDFIDIEQTDAAGAGGNGSSSQKIKLRAVFHWYDPGNLEDIELYG